MTRRQYFTAGFKDGIPICLGYIAVSFTFGIMAKKVGISIFDAVLISLTNVTSAGQFAGLSLIASTASYIEMAITQLIINLRYCLMSCALSQKIDPEAPLFHRFLIAYGVTDEIFGVTVCKGGKLSTGLYLSLYSDGYSVHFLESCPVIYYRLVLSVH